MDSKKRKKESGKLIKIAGMAGGDINVDLKFDLEIGEDLNHEARRAASLFGWYAVLAEQAESRIDKLKTQFSIWQSRQERELIQAHGGPFKFAGDLTRELHAIPKFRDYADTMSRFKKESRMLKQIAKAFEMKKDLIQTMNANRRAENR